jgi:hypothetical protein
MSRSAPSKSKRGTEFKAGGFVAADSPTGPFIAQVLEAKSRTIRVRTDEGIERELARDSKLLRVANPQVFPKVMFTIPRESDPAGAVDQVIELYRGERKTTQERRVWALSQVDQIPDAPEVDELIRHRYDDFKRQWAEALEQTISESASQGNYRPLFTALDVSVPTEARRIALLVAVRLRLKESATLLGAAALHKTQITFAREAVRALASIAPERLPLLSQFAQTDVLTEIDPDTLHSPESEAIAAWVQLPAGRDVGENVDLRADVLMHWLIAQSANDVLHVFGKTGAIVEALRKNLADELGTLLLREKVTSYETVLRAAISRALLLDPKSSSETLAAAARAVLKDADDRVPREIAANAHEPAVSQLIEYAFDRPDEIVASLLRAIPKHLLEREGLLTRRLQSRLLSGDLTNASSFAVISALATNGNARDLVATRAASFLSVSDGTDSQELLATLVRHSIDLPIGELSLTHTVAIADALPTASSQYSADFLRSVREQRPALQSEIAERLSFPSDWLSNDAALREEILNWTAFLKVDESGNRLFESAAFLSAPELWNDWDDQHRQVVLDRITTLNPEQATRLLSAIFAKEKNANKQRVVLVTWLERVATQDLSLLADDKLAFPAALVRAAILEAISTDTRALRDKAAEDRKRASNRIARLEADVIAQIDRSLQFTSERDQLNELLLQLRQEVMRSSEQTIPDPEITEYENAFQGNLTGSDALTIRMQYLLRKITARTRSSKSAVRFFLAELDLALAQVDFRLLKEFINSNDRLLSQASLEAIEQVAGRFLIVGAKASEVIDLLGSGSKASVFVRVSGIARDSVPDAAVELLAQGKILTPEIGGYFVSLRAELQKKREPHSAPEFADFTRRISVVLDAIDGVVLNYMRVRRVLSDHGLEAVEPLLGRCLSFDKLISGNHRVLGTGVADMPHEIQTSGLKDVETDSVITPASVAPIAE